jgi:hypothetical protein
MKEWRKEVLYSLSLSWKCARKERGQSSSMVHSNWKQNKVWTGGGGNENDRRAKSGSVGCPGPVLRWQYHDSHQEIGKHIVCRTLAVTSSPSHSATTKTHNHIHITFVFSVPDAARFSDCIYKEGSESWWWCNGSSWTLFIVKIEI